jgi:hypothetical protein
LAQFDAEVEREQPDEFLVGGNGQGLEAGGQPESVDQTEPEDRCPEPAEPGRAAANAHDADERDAAGDDDVDQRRVQPPSGQGGGDSPAHPVSAASR